MRKLSLYMIVPVFWLMIPLAQEPGPETKQRVTVTGQTDSLYQQVMELDKQVFDAFNRRDTIQFAAMFSQDLEFFHDKGGLTGYMETISFLRSTMSSGSDLQRTLEPGSAEVYPIPGYGAIQTGTHIFCHTENGKQDCGRFKFLHIWKKTEGRWQITRVVSYDH